MTRKFPTELKEEKYRIEEAARQYGVDFYPTIFEMVDWDEMCAIGAYIGYPSRYHHWRFGMSYDRSHKQTYHGLSKYYELVINNDPCYAYLLDSNNLTSQKMVMCHVYWHNDFFKNNVYFKHTNRKMLDEFANHATRVNKYIDMFGPERVEKFIDTCLSIENLIDPYSWEYKKETSKPSKKSLNKFDKIDVPHYMDSYVNPPEYLKRKRQEKMKEARRRMKNPPSPMRDVLLFLMNNAPLKRWQKDILSIIREEAYYFLPQAQTKVMNEGWATYGHLKMMTGSDRQYEYRDKIYPGKKPPLPILDDSGLIDFSELHSSISGGGRGLNPYWLGVQIWRDIEERWDKGKFGSEWNDCDDYVTRQKWDKKLGLGREKIFEVRKLYNDINFIHEFLTKDLVAKLFMFQYGFDKQKEVWYVVSKKYDQIRKQLLFNMTNFGQPVIRVEDGNFQNKGILLLVNDKNDYNFILDEPTAIETLKRIQSLWTRPVYLKTWDDKGEPSGYAVDEKGEKLEEKWWEEDSKEEEVREGEFDDLDPSTSAVGIAF